MPPKTRCQGPPRRCWLRNGSKAVHRRLSSHRAFSSSRSWAIASREDRRMIRTVRICCRGRLDEVVEPRCRVRGWEEYPRSMALGSGDGVGIGVGGDGILSLKCHTFVDSLCRCGYVSERRRFRVRICGEEIVWKLRATCDSFPAMGLKFYARFIGHRHGISVIE